MVNEIGDGSEQISYLIDCWQITIGADKHGEEERSLDEVLCTYKSTSSDMIHDDDDDSSTLVNIHRTFCMNLYGCELWNISNKYTKEIHTG